MCDQLNLVWSSVCGLLCLFFRVMHIPSTEQLWITKRQGWVLECQWWKTWDQSDKIQPRAHFKAYSVPVIVAKNQCFSFPSASTKYRLVEFSRSSGAYCVLVYKRRRYTEIILLRTFQIKSLLSLLTWTVQYQCQDQMIPGSQSVKLCGIFFISRPRMSGSPKATQWSCRGEWGFKSGSFRSHSETITTTPHWLL